MKEKKYLSVISNVRNEELNLKELHSRLIRVCNSLNKPYEIIYVENGSTDNSLKVLKKLKKAIVITIRVPLPPKRSTQSAALDAGIKIARGKMLVTIDSDLQNPPEEIPKLIKKHNIKTMLDLPCGDFNWMRSVDLGIDQYTGADIVEEVITKNQQAYGNEKYRFQVLDITHNDLPKRDLIFCRDCLVHLSYDDIYRAFRNIKRCGITYILTTTFTGFFSNHDIVSGDWRPLNLESVPFNLPDPVESINENCTEGGGKFADKSMGLWRVENLAV